MAAPRLEAGFVVTGLQSPALGEVSGATGINASGQISGTEYGSGTSGAVESSGGQFQVINTSALPGATSSSGAAIGANGDVVGTFFDNIDHQSHAFRSAGTTAVDFGSFTDPKLQGASSWGVGVSAAGELLGTARLNDGSEVVFRSTSPGAFNAISLPGGSLIGLAAGMNSGGTAVGSYLNSVGVYKVFIDKEGAPATDLLSQFGARGFGLNSYGAAINDRGDVAGYGDFNGQSHAFIALASGKFIDIGVAGGFSSSIAAGMNNLDQVVGKLTNSGGGSRAFLWDPVAGLIDLNSLLTSSDQTHWILISATGINDSDQIVGQGYYNGQLEGFLLTLIPGTTLFAPTLTVPTPPSVWMALAGLTMVGGWTRFRRGRTAARETA